MTRLILTTRSAQETERLGGLLGSLLEPGAFIALAGDLGGGKTCFTRGVVSVAAPESSHLTASPTFAIMNQYPGRTPIYHFDFYRLSGDDDVIDLGFEDYFRGDGICIVEWSERLQELLPPERLTIRFDNQGCDTRQLTFQAIGVWPERLLERFAAEYQEKIFDLKIDNLL